MTVQTIQPAGLMPATSAVVDIPQGLPAEMAAIVQWANTAEAARRLVEAIVDTPFFPQAFWPKFDNRDAQAAALARQTAIASGTAAVLYGGPLRLNPLQSLANIHVVKGKPGLPAELMVALVQSAGHEVGVEDLTDFHCKVWGKRAGSEQVRRATFTMDRAKKAGYTSQNTKYGTDPQSMLYARAMSILCRQMAPEVLKGLSTAEELQDEPDGDAPAPKTRTVQRAARPALAAPAAATPAADPLAAAVAQATEQRQAAAPPAAQGLPPLPGEDVPAPAVQHEAGQAPAAGPEPISKAQWDAINARFAEIGVQGDGQKAARAAVIRAVLGLPNLDIPAMTWEQARFTIDNLAGDPGVKMVADILTRAAAPVHLIPVLPEPEPAAEQPEAGLPSLPGEDDADPYATYDPSLELDGAEAAAEGR